MGIQQVSFSNNVQTGPTNIKTVRTNVSTNPENTEYLKKKNNTKNYVFAGIGTLAVIVAIAKHKQISKFFNDLTT